jgi:hypothetical protein
MALPASGPLTLADIQGEFGGSNPISLSEYYAGGGLVPAGTTGTYGAVPSSGEISIRNFYGTSNIVIDFTDQSIVGIQFGSAQAGYWIFGAGGNIGKAYEFVNFGPQTLLEQWITPTTTAGNYEVYVTASGSTPFGTLNSWVALSGNPSWYLDVSGSGNSYFCTLSFQVRKIGTATVLDTWTVTLDAQAL